LQSQRLLLGLIQKISLPSHLNSQKDRKMLNNFKISAQFLLMLCFFVLLLRRTAGIGYLGIKTIGDEAAHAIEEQGKVAQIAAAQKAISMACNKSGKT